jgi:hypothetical protein
MILLFVIGGLVVFMLGFSLGAMFSYLQWLIERAQE